MGRKARVQRTAEEKWRIVLEGLRAGTLLRLAASMRSLQISFPDGKMKCDRARRLRLGRRAQPRGLTRSAFARSSSWSRPWAAARCRSRSLKTCWASGLRAGPFASQELVAQGKEAKLVAETLSISHSSLYYRKRPHSSRADRTDDERIVAACREKPAYGYRRIAWWLQRKQHMEVNAKRVLR